MRSRIWFSAADFVTAQAPTPASRKAISNNAAYIAARRTLVDARMRSSRADDIAGAANGVDQRRISAPVDLPADAADVSLDDVGAWIEMEVPNALKQHGTGDNAPRVKHQLFEQTEFAR